MDSKTSIAAEVFLDPRHKKPRYLFGCNDHSAALAKIIDIDGFVDDFRAGSTYCNKPVVSGEQVPVSAVVINCVLMARSWMSKKRVQQINVEHRLDYGDLLARAPDLTPIPDFVVDTQRDYTENHRKWVWLETKLEDAQSRKVLQDILEFRKTGNLAFLAQYTFSPAEQYFASICPIAAGDVFVDCGGFDGDTTEEFVRRNPDYRSVWFFEPSEANMLKAKKRLKGARDIYFVQKGVSDRIETLSFNSGAGSASAITEGGDVAIQVTTVDQVINEPVSFIKMDLEGWELKALEGARRHIQQDRPKLAVAVYHQASDFWMIPEFILGLCNNYKLYLRHYTEGWTETVMYFVPR